MHEGFGAYNGDLSDDEALMIALRESMVNEPVAESSDSRSSDVVEKTGSCKSGKERTSRRSRHQRRAREKSRTERKAASVERVAQDKDRPRENKLHDGNHDVLFSEMSGGEVNGSGVGGSEGSEENAHQQSAGESSDAEEPQAGSRRRRGTPVSSSSLAAGRSSCGISPGSRALIDFSIHTPDAGCGAEEIDADSGAEESDLDEWTDEGSDLDMSDNDVEERGRDERGRDERGRKEHGRKEHGRKEHGRKERSGRERSRRERSRIERGGKEEEVGDRMTSGWGAILETLVSDYVQSSKKEMIKGVRSVLHFETAVPEMYRAPPIHRDNLNGLQAEGLLLARYQIFAGLLSLGNEYAADQGLYLEPLTDLDGHHVAAAINKLNMPIKVEDSRLMIKALNEDEKLITSRAVEEGKKSLFLQRISQLELLATWPSDDLPVLRSPPVGRRPAAENNNESSGRQVDERGFLMPGNCFAPTKKRKKARVDTIYRQPLPAYDYKRSPPEYYTKIPWECWCSIFDRIKLKVQPNGIVW